MAGTPKDDEVSTGRGLDKGHRTACARRVPERAQSVDAMPRPTQRLAVARDDRAPPTRRSNRGQDGSDLAAVLPERLPVPAPA